MIANNLPYDGGAKVSKRNYRYDKERQKELAKDILENRFQLPQIHANASFVPTRRKLTRGSTKERQESSSEASTSLAALSVNALHHSTPSTSSDPQPSVYSDPAAIRSALKELGLNAGFNVRNLVKMQMFEKLYQVGVDISLPAKLSAPKHPESPGVPRSDKSRPRTKTEKVRLEPLVLNAKKKLELLEEEGQSEKECKKSPRTFEVVSRTNSELQVVRKSSHTGPEEYKPYKPAPELPAPFAIQKPGYIGEHHKPASLDATKNQFPVRHLRPKLNPPKGLLKITQLSVPQSPMESPTGQAQDPTFHSSSVPASYATRPVEVESPRSYIRRVLPSERELPSLAITTSDKRPLAFLATAPLPSPKAHSNSQQILAPIFSKERSQSIDVVSPTLQPGCVPDIKTARADSHPKLFSLEDQKLFQPKDAKSEPRSRDNPGQSGTDTCQSCDASEVGDAGCSSSPVKKSKPSDAVKKERLPNDSAGKSKEKPFIYKELFSKEKFEYTRREVRKANNGWHAVKTLAPAPTGRKAETNEEELCSASFIEHTTGIDSKLGSNQVILPPIDHTLESEKAAELFEVGITSKEPRSSQLGVMSALDVDRSWSQREDMRNLPSNVSKETLQNQLANYLK